MPPDNRRQMSTTVVPPTGRERRRKGLVNRVRRGLYALLLLVAAPGASAVDELAAWGKYRNLPSTASAEVRSLATVQGLIVLRAHPEGGEDAPLLALETVTAKIHGDLSEPAPHFAIAAVSSGGGFDVVLADVGTLRLAFEFGGIESDRAWSLGGQLGLAAEPGAERKVAEVPAVRVRVLYASETRYLPFEVSVRESQIGFKWRA